jgi:hypothetical protein
MMMTVMIAAVASLIPFDGTNFRYRKGPVESTG